MSGGDDARFDPSGWDGDPDQLYPFIDEVGGDHELCERTFASKQDAFTLGLDLERHRAERAHADSPSGGGHGGAEQGEGSDGSGRAEWDELGVVLTRQATAIDGAWFDVVEAGGEGTFVGEWTWTLVRDGRGWWAEVTPPGGGTLNEWEERTLGERLGPFAEEAIALRWVAYRLLAALVVFERRVRG